MTAIDNTPVSAHTSVTSEQPLGGLLNSAEVAQMIRVPQATLRYWRHVGIGPRSFKMGPRRVLYRADDVEAWVAAQYADQR
jgi:predicted DNA-binding transcriptional regulator AlpA